MEMFWVFFCAIWKTNFTLKDTREFSLEDRNTKEENNIPRRKMFKDGWYYNGSRGYKLCGQYSLECIQMTNLKI